MVAHPGSLGLSIARTDAPPGDEPITQLDPSPTWRHIGLSGTE